MAAQVTADRLQGGEVILLDPTDDDSTAEVGAVSRSQHRATVYLMLRRRGVTSQAELAADDPVTVVA